MPHAVVGRIRPCSVRQPNRRHSKDKLVHRRVGSPLPRRAAKNTETESCSDSSKGMTYTEDVHACRQHWLDNSSRCAWPLIYIQCLQVGDSLEEFLLTATDDGKLRQLMMSLSEAIRTIAFKV